MERKLLRRRIFRYYDSIGDLCKEIKMSTPYMSLVLAGEADPSFNSARKMIERLEIKRGEIGELFFPEVKE